MSGPRRVLVYRCGALGDTVVALPAIDATRRAFAGAELVLMTANDDNGVVWTDEVLREFGWFAHVVTYRTGAVRTLRGLVDVLRRVRAARPEVVVYLGSDRNSGARLWRDRLFFRLAGARRFIAPGSTKVTFLGRLRRDARDYPPEVERLLGGLARAGIAGSPTHFPLPLGPQHAAKVTAVLAETGLGSGRPLVALCPGSKQPAKRWPLERWAELGSRLIAEGGVDVLVVGGPDEARTAEQVTAGWPGGRSAVLAGRLSVLESAETLRRCRLYVGNDTGAMHLAAAVGTPCVAVFAAREPGRSWHPYGPGHVVLRHDVPCANCYLNECTTEGLRCLTGIPVARVWAACRATLAARRAA